MSEYIEKLTPNEIRELINIKSDSLMDLIVANKHHCREVLNKLDSNKKNAFHYMIKSDYVKYFNLLQSELDFGSKANNLDNNVFIYALNKGKMVFFNNMMDEVIKKDIPFKDWCGGWMAYSVNGYKTPRVMQHIIFSQPYNMNEVFKRLDFEYTYEEARSLLYNVLFYALKPSIANSFIPSFQKSVNNISEVKSVVSQLLYVVDEDFMKYYNHRYALDNDIDSVQYDRLYRKLEAQLLLSPLMKNTPKGLSELNVGFNYYDVNNEIVASDSHKSPLKL